MFHDPKHYGKSAEQIYDELYAAADKNSLSKLGKLLDEHIDWTKSGQGHPSYTDDELREIRDEVVDAVVQASQSAGHGNTPAGIQRMINELTEPQMNWREIIQQRIQSTVKYDYSWSRPNRKHQHTGVILPGSNYDQSIDLCIAIDMSGSISNQQASLFLSEIKGITEEFRNYTIKVWCFDTKIYNEQDFDMYSEKDITEYQVKGGGGTSFMANWKYMEKHDIVPKKFIMFTDGYCDEWGIEDYCDTVFVIHGSKSIVAPYGTTCYYEE